LARAKKYGMISAAMFKAFSISILLVMTTSGYAKSDEPYTPWGGPVRPPKIMPESGTRGVNSPEKDETDEEVNQVLSKNGGIGRYCVVGTQIFGPGLPLQLGEGCKSQNGSAGYIATIVE
jgi:hypothetical protein